MVIPVVSTATNPVYNIFINDLDNGPEHILSKLPDDTKLGQIADISENRAAIQSDFSRLEKWSDRSLMKFSREGETFFMWGGTRQAPVYSGGPQDGLALWRRAKASWWTSS